MIKILQSDFLSLSKNDFVKAFVVAVLSPVAAIVGQAFVDFSTGAAFSLDYTNLWHVAVAAGVAYLIKNLFTNNVGQFFANDTTLDTIPPAAPIQ